MTGRRRDSRFLLSSPVSGNLHVREEVAIEKWTEEEIEVLSTIPSRPEERLELELPGDGVGQTEVVVRESRAVVAADGSLRYRLRLSLVVGSPSASPEKGLRQS